MQHELILASASPRRREILELMDLPFTVETAAADEAAVTASYLARETGYPGFGQLAGELVQALAEAKAEAVLRKKPEAANQVVLAADTVVVLDRSILGKPISKAEAQEMLERLCGRVHQVYTGVSIRSGERSESFHAVSEVEFYGLDGFARTWISRYIAGGSPFDKAGGYGIQDQGALFVKGIRGDFFNVMGLPLAETARRLESFLGNREKHEG